MSFCWSSSFNAAVNALPSRSRYIWMNIALLLKAENNAKDYCRIAQNEFRQKVQVRTFTLWVWNFSSSRTQLDCQMSTFYTQKRIEIICTALIMSSNLERKLLEKNFERENIENIESREYRKRNLEKAIV